MDKRKEAEQTQERQAGVTSQRRGKALSLPVWLGVRARGRRRWFLLDCQGRDKRRSTTMGVRVADEEKLQGQELCL